VALISAVGVRPVWEDSCGGAVNKDFGPFDVWSCVRGGEGVVIRPRLVLSEGQGEDICTVSELLGRCHVSASEYQVVVGSPPCGCYSYLVLR
jgi:hypothetical protein